MPYRDVQKQDGNSLTILQRIAGNDRTAFKDCLDTYGGFVWTLVKKFTASTGEAEDAAQEIFIDIWRYAGRFDPGKCAENIFIGLVARRYLIKRRATVENSETSKGKAETGGIYNS